MSEKIYQKFADKAIEFISEREIKVKWWKKAFVVSVISLIITPLVSFNLIRWFEDVFFLIAIIAFFVALISLILWLGELYMIKNTKRELNDIKKRILNAVQREMARDYDSAIEIWEGIGEIEEAARVRTLQAESGSVKVAQKVVHGDEVTKTEIKDSVLNRSNLGGSSSKMQELEKLTEMKEKGLISDEEYEKMKQEIIG